jgi:hypothetical protein
MWHPVRTVTWAWLWPRVVLGLLLVACGVLPWAIGCEVACG